MRTVYIVTATATQASIDAVRPHNPELADLMAVPMVQKRFTKRSADKIEAELKESGCWVVTRSTGLAGTFEDVLMHVTGLCPAKVA